MISKIAYNFIKYIQNWNLFFFEVKFIFYDNFMTILWQFIQNKLHNH